MIIVRLISGLGNQLFQYTVGRHLSMKHGVPLKLDTSFFETQSLRSYKLDNFKIKAQIASAEEINKLLYWEKRSGFVSRVYKKTEMIIPRTRRRYFRELEWWAYDPDLFTTSSRVYLDGYWQHFKYFEDINPKIFQELSLREEDPEMKVLEKDISDNRSSVSIHIRRGDYITDPDANNLMGILPMAYYSKAIGLMDSKLIDPHYYIFSDDLQWAKDNLKIKLPATFVEPGENPKDFVELSLMSKCNHNIIANSSFSWWGAFLNANPDKIVIAPANWVVDKEKNKKIHLQFPSWIKI